MKIMKNILSCLSCIRYNYINVYNYMDLVGVCISVLVLGLISFYQGWCDFGVSLLLVLDIFIVNVNITEDLKFGFSNTDLINYYCFYNIENKLYFGRRYYSDDCNDITHCKSLDGVMLKNFVIKEEFLEHRSDDLDEKMREIKNLINKEKDDDVEMSKRLKSYEKILWLYLDADKINEGDLYNEILNILNDLESVNEGFVNKVDVTKYPIISKLYSGFTVHPDYCTGEKVFTTYKWIFNILILNLYYYCLKFGDNSVKGKSNKDVSDVSDIKVDFNTLAVKLYSKLDSSIRKKLQKRGVSIIQNVYTGFDTEYVNIDKKYNNLLSVQLAVNTDTLLKIPFKIDYTVHELNPLTNEEYGNNLIKSDYTDFDYLKVDSSINYLINKIRLLKYPEYDDSIKVLIAGLMNKDIPYMIKDNTIVFKFNRTPINKFIYFNDKKGYSLKNILNKSNTLAEPWLIKTYESILEMLKSFYDWSILKDNNKLIESEFTDKSTDSGLDTDTGDTDTDVTVNIKDIIESSVEDDDDDINNNNNNNNDNNNNNIKSRSRSYMSSFTSDKISVTKIRYNFLIAHLTNADLSILNDFEDFKEFLNIVNKCFITLGKPFNYFGCNVIIRDTMLLSPAKSRSLDSLGKLYGLKKVDLSKEVKSNMDLLLKENKDLFIKYAVNDAIITLVHANNMQDFNFELKEIGIPTTLASLSKRYVLLNWSLRGYKGYQVSHKYLIGDTSSFLTPKGLMNNLEPGLRLNYYISNYKGGRNESFMYGVDLNTRWFDYDLTSAYTTVMSACGNPDYKLGKYLTKSDLKSMSKHEILYSFIIIKCSFEFNELVKYPSIPCYLDENTTIYPLKGEAILTGSEYLLAKEQGCDIKIKEIFYIPFEKKVIDKKLKTVNLPFEEVVSDLQDKRRQYEKGTLRNYLYKEFLNNMYGLTVRGINDKRKYDIKSNKPVRMEAGELSNPIIGSWITAFIRSIIGECLHNLGKNNYKVVSVTTDGFITDKDDLEEFLKDNYLFSEYRKIRYKLSNDSSGLELKHTGVGIISWTTRGQLSADAKIKATTGFQSRVYSIQEMEVIFLNALSTKEKRLEYIQQSLRSAKNIYKYGGHVTALYKDQVFRLHYDNRRVIQEPEVFDVTMNLLDSLPVKTKEVAGNLRSISKIHKSEVYNKLTTPLKSNVYKDYTDLAIRNFIKGLLSEPRLFNMSGDDLKTYAEIIDFVRGYKKGVRVSKSSISNLKNRKIILKAVPKTKETLKFVEYIKKRFKNFDTDAFLGE